tara:strand:+ start:184 stop:315 length:132 start_codon:yes stop_codon:yes gene_type:complete
MSELCIEIEELYNQGLEIIEIARILNITTQMVEGGLEVMGVSL